jgi:hypothetical protein
MKNNIVVQCSKYPISDYIVKQLMENFPGWEYICFNDFSMRKFMIDNPIKEFPGAEKRLGLFSNGAHKADYFRYFYLYSRGGIFIDSDLMIESSILDDIKKYDFITVLNTKCNIESCEKCATEEPYVFQGLLYCEPGNKIIKEAFNNLYRRKIHDSHLVKDYHAACRDLYKIILKDTEYNKKLYTEKYVIINDEEFEDQQAALIIDNDIHIGVHYYQYKNIPKIPIKYNINERISKFMDEYL